MQPVGNSVWHVYQSLRDQIKHGVASFEIKKKLSSSFVFPICRLCVLWRLQKWVRAAEESTISHFWLLQVTSHKQWHFMGRGSSSFLPGFLSIVLPELANSIYPPQPPLLLLFSLLHHTLEQTPSPPSQTAELQRTRLQGRLVQKWNTPSQRAWAIDI